MTKQLTKPIKKIRVLIVDDSALVRSLLTSMLSSDPAIEVVGTAADPYVAREKIKKLNPDVLTLDIEMPRMDGITFLQNLMRLRPMPVVMVSSLTTHGADITFEALRLGAIDFIPKPSADIANQLENYTEELTGKIRVAASARIQKISRMDTSHSDEKAVRRLISGSSSGDTLIAIGASTGGTEAIHEVLTNLPANAPGVVITQHIPASFSHSFAQRLDKASDMNVVEARDGDLIIPGHVFIAPGDQHLRVVRDGSRLRCQLGDDEKINRHRPSVDALFHSILALDDKNIIAALLTGMGEDGARGLLALQESGAWTIAQDEKSSVVWGMPGAAVKMGAAQEVVPLSKVADSVLLAVEKNIRRRKQCS